MDREKVIGELEYCRNNQKCNDCEKCQRGGKSIMTCESLVGDAIALLKEQEPKPPNLAQDADGIWATCGKCGHKLRAFLAMEMDTYIPKYCANCGKEVKWE